MDLLSELVFSFSRVWRVVLHYFLQKTVNSELRLAVLNLKIFSSIVLNLFLIYNQKYYNYASSLL